MTYEIWPRRAEVLADVASAIQSPAPADPTPVAAPDAPRPVYRHSILPGGAYSRGEVADAMRKDAVVATHYQHVDVDRVHTKTITAARAVYVSYRIGNQVYWTRNRVRLSPGETVLTDGHTEIRARCGNLLSDDAQQPVAAQEPAPAALDELENETGSSTIAGARGDDGRLTHVPFLADWSEASSVAFEKNEPIPGAPGVDMPMWFGAAGGGTSPFPGSSTGTTGTSLVAPLGGGSERGGSPGGGGSNGGGGSTSGGGSNGGGSNGGGGSNEGGGSTGGGGSNDGGGGGGGGTDVKFVPPDQPPFTTTGEAGTTTTGEPGTTTTGTLVIETTGGGDDGEVPSVPEPSSLVLLALGACGAALRARQRRRG